MLTATTARQQAGMRTRSTSVPIFDN